MTIEEVEMSLEQFLRSKWFGYTYKIASVAGVAIISIGGSVASWAIFDTRQSASSAVTAVAEMQAVQDRRAAVAEIRQELETRDREALIQDVKTIQQQILSQQNDIGEIKGLVRQLAKDGSGMLTPSALRTAR